MSGAAPHAEDAPPQFHGVALEPYAGVRAGLAEGLPLDDLLAQEVIPKAAWPKADAAWKQRLAADGINSPLFSSYRDKLAEAEDWLARRVVPLDEDLAAWMSFLAVWSAHVAPFELLAALGLGMNDIARLQRAWARRLAQDASLQRAAAELAKKPPAPLPAVTVTEAVCKPFPWSLRAPALAPSPSPTVTSGALEAALPSAAELVRSAESGQSWLTSTAPTLDLPPGPALPFVAGAAPSPLARDPVPPEPRAKAPPSWLTGTAPALDSPPGPALPFTPQGREAPPRPAPVLPPGPESALPSLTLEQHAFLCVELAIDPARSAETLARYRQTPETKAQLDAHYRDKLAAHALMRAAWNYAYQTYGAWLASRRPPSR